MTVLRPLFGRRRVPAGPLVRIRARWQSNLANLRHADLMATDCTRTVRIKRFFPAQTAISLVDADLAIPSSGLDPNVDWHVYLKAVGVGGAAEFSNAYRFPSDTAEASAEGTITDIKASVLDGLRTRIADINRRIGSMDGTARLLDRAARLASPVPGLADEIFELSADVADRMAAAARERERLEAELERRAREYERQFGRKP